MTPARTASFPERRLCEVQLTIDELSLVVAAPRPVFEFACSCLFELTRRRVPTRHTTNDIGNVLN